MTPQLFIGIPFEEPQMGEENHLISPTFWSIEPTRYQVTYNEIW